MYKNNKINLNKLTVKRVLKDYYVKLIYLEKGSNTRHFSTWELKNDNCISDLAKNFYIRTLKSVNKEYYNLDNTLAKEYKAIKLSLLKQSDIKIIGVELTNKKKDNNGVFGDEIIIIK